MSTTTMSSTMTLPLATSRPTLPAFSFPALPTSSTSTTTTDSCNSSQPQNTSSSKRSHHRRTMALSRPSMTSVQKQIRKAQMQTLPPVPPLPVDPSLLQKPILTAPSRCSPRKPAPLPDMTNFLSVNKHHGTFFLDASRPVSTIRPSAALSVSDDGASSCPTLVSDHALDSANLMPSPSSVIHHDAMDVDEEDEEDDGEFWACIGSESCQEAHEDTKHTAIAEWVHACSVADHHEMHGVQWPSHQQ